MGRFAHLYSHSHMISFFVLPYIPRFTSDVRITSISILGTRDDCAPSEMKACTNKQGLTFTEIPYEKFAQCWKLVDTRTAEGPITSLVPEYKTMGSKFARCTHLSLFFPSTFGSDTMKISYIDIKGEWVLVSISKMCLARSL